MRNYLHIGKTCISCDACRIECPEKAIITDGKDYVIDTWSCTQCGICVELCPEKSIIRKEKPDLKSQ